jgi:hypothetical protein
MKLSKISMALGAMMMGAAGQSFALAPTSSFAVQVYISGASAQQLVIGDVISTMCQAGTIDVMYDTGTAGKDYRAYACKASGISGVANGTNVVVHNRAKGGSVWGVIPVARGQSIERMALDGSCVSSGTVDILSGTPVLNVTRWNCPNKVNAVPDGGVSDVEPALFVGINKASPADTDVSPTDLGNMTVGSQNAVIFGIPVSIDVYNALSTAQGGGVPSLTRAQITSIFTGTYQNWAQVDAALAGVGPAGDGSIKVCRRVNGSGSQAATNQFFMNFPCANPGALLPTTAGDSGPGYTVVENSSSGFVESCVNAANGGAIGLLATERQPAGGANWKYVKVNGVEPTVANATSGAYEWFVEQSIQWRNTTVNGAPAPSAQQLAILEVFKTKSGDPAVLQFTNGVAALPTNGYTPSIPFDPTNPVMQGTKFTNSCAAPQLF